MTTIAFLGFMAAVFTVATFAIREIILAYISMVFWFILGGYAYTQFVNPWVDWQYFLMLASFFIGAMMPWAGFVLKKNNTGVADTLDQEADQEDWELEKEEMTPLERIKRKGKKARSYNARKKYNERMFADKG